MKIEVLGVGCPKCSRMFEAAQAAARKIGGDVSVEKLYDLDQIAKYGVVSFPALVVDGTLRSTGKLLTPEEIIKLLAP